MILLTVCYHKLSHCTREKIEEIQQKTRRLQKTRKSKKFLWNKMGEWFILIKK